VAELPQDRLFFPTSGEWVLVRIDVLDDLLRRIPKYDRLFREREQKSLSLKAARGYICECVIREVNMLSKELKPRRKIEPERFEVLRQRHPDFEVLEILASQPFDDEDRELICNPARWERRPTGHAYGILTRYFRPGRTPLTEHAITSYRKAYRKAVRPPRPTA
jgi:hypothetical protein